MKEKNKVKKNQKVYLVTGIVMLLMSVYINIGYLMKGDFPEGILLFAAGINQICLAYLAPHIFPKDERAKQIREKAMSTNYVFMLVIIIIMVLLVGQIQLSAFHALNILGTFYLVSPTFIMIFYANRL